MRQADDEEVSDYLARIQRELKEIERVEGKAIEKHDMILFRQFHQGLLPGILDLMTLHIGMKDYRTQDVFPPYSELLQKVNMYELDRRERQMRMSSATGVSTAGVNVFGDW